MTGGGTPHEILRRRLILSALAQLARDDIRVVARGTSPPRAATDALV
jgi:hypothetical protein